LGYRTVSKQFGRVFVAVAFAAGLSACGAMQQGDLLDSTFWSTNILQKRSLDTELGMAEMSKGNYGLAETHFNKALHSNPKDTRALLGLGMLYQNTGQGVKAREAYEAIIALRPDRSERMVVWTNFEPRPIGEIASVNLAMMESGGVPMNMERGAAGSGATMAPAMPSAGARAAPGSGPSSSAMLGRITPNQSSMRQGAASPAAPAQMAAVRFSDAEANIDSRFKTIANLRDQGLITPAEFSRRRQANIGALLPLTSPPPAAGLDRPVPNADQISARLRAIGRALEMRAITIGQHSAERSMILDALMPAAPVSVANPAPPPQGLMAAADAVRRLEMMNASGLITSDEYAKERAAIEQSMQPRGAAPRPTAAAAKPAGPQEMAAKGGSQPAVHLASYRSQKAADRGWAQLRRAHRSLLGKLRHEISKVNLGSKGTFYRLKVGPVKDANGMCRKLKKRRQFCEASVMGG
jgi:tetratricopeptide (TPR) repeat protein